MNSRTCWRNAEEAAKWLVDKDSLRSIVLLLARLPLLP